MRKRRSSDWSARTRGRGPDMLFHLDTDFFVYALSTAGPERVRLLALADSDAEVQLSAIVWYEFSRGPRTPDGRPGR